MNSHYIRLVRNMIYKAHQWFTLNDESWRLASDITNATGEYIQLAGNWNMTALHTERALRSAPTILQPGQRYRDEITYIIAIALGPKKNNSDYDVTGNTPRYCASYNSARQHYLQLCCHWWRYTYVVSLHGTAEWIPSTMYRKECHEYFRLPV